MSDNRMICANGHYYDGSRYTKCPHCAEGLARVEPSTFSITDNKNKETASISEKKSVKKGLFSRKKNDIDIEEIPKPVVPSSREKKQSNSDNHDFTKGLQEVNSDMRSEEVNKEKESGAEGSSIVYKQEAIVQKNESVVIAEKQVHPQALSEAYAEVTTPPKTVADKDKTVSYYFTAGKTEPPVGYLICTAGEDFGCGFPLKTGNNSIGRGQSMDVIIMDSKVSREKQAFVMYEPKNRQFFIRQGESAGLCYLNGTVVLTPTEIHPFDRIGVGDTELMLIAICCEQFSWDDCQKGRE